MKNITVSIDEETHRRARIRAAELGTSVSAMVRDYLRTLAPQEANGGAQGESEQSETPLERQIRLMNEVLKDIERTSPGFSASENLPRDELYDREAARREAAGLPRKENGDL